MGNGGTDTATVSIEITGVNDDPIAMADGFGTNENTPFTTPDVRLNDEDPDTDVAELVVVSFDDSMTQGLVTGQFGMAPSTTTPNGAF